jgi:N-acetylglucosamine-6-sulfatase
MAKDLTPDGISMRKLWQLIAGSVVLLPLAMQAAPRPNVLFMFSDDHALKTVGAYPGSIHQTPNLDRLARSGAVFTRSFVVNSICCPSRAAIMTGKHSHANGVTGNGSHWDTQQWTYMRALGDAGYQTGLVGKWHLRDGPDDEFQHWEVLSGSGGQGHYYHPEFRNREGEFRAHGFSSDVIADKAMAWLDKRDKNKPFLLCANFKAPHVLRVPAVRFMNRYWDMNVPEPPSLFDDHASRHESRKRVWMGIQGLKGLNIGVSPTADELAKDPSKTPDFLKRMTAEERAAWHRAYDPHNSEYQRLLASGKLKPGTKAHTRYAYQRLMKDYFRCVDGIDDNVGRLLDYLDKNGLAENTIVVYSSDQGFNLGEHGWIDKRWMNEETVMAPLLMRWPGRIKAGSTIDALVQNIDFAPTFLEAAGLKPPADVHGRSLVPVLNGALPSNWRQEILYRYYDGGIVGRPGAYNMPRHQGVREQRYKLIHFVDYDAYELYDLERDPTERVNRYNDPEYAEHAARLRAKLEAQLTATNAPPMPKLKPKRKRKK